MKFGIQFLASKKIRVKHYTMFESILYQIFRFESYVFEKGLWPPNPSYEQTNIFLMSCAAATIGAIVFSKGAPYRKPLYTNGIQFLQIL